MKADLQVLVVEDVETMRQLLVHLVSGIPGFSVSGSAPNGWEARIEVSKRRPDLILLDEVLPGESAQELLDSFVADGIPVILLTGMAKPTHPVPLPALGRMVKPGWKSIEEDRIRFRAEILGFLGASSG